MFSCLTSHFLAGQLLYGRVSSYPKLVEFPGCPREDFGIVGLCSGLELPRDCRGALGTALFPSHSSRGLLDTCTWLALTFSGNEGREEIPHEAVLLQPL